MDPTLFTTLCLTLPCLMTTLGAMLVFFFSKNSSKLWNMLTIGLASGIMLSASIWSLLIPALENASTCYEGIEFLPVVFGFVIGAVFMVFLDFVCSKFFTKKAQKDNQKAFKMFTAITIHNIPEGLSVGFAAGTAIASSLPLLTPLMFSIGIAIQNFPEGLATALPMQKCLKSKTKGFLLGTASGIVEPIFALFGYFLAATIQSLLPWLLSFSAGAMIYVIVEEMIPEIHADNRSWGVWAFVVGFVIMMLLDICL